MQTVYVLVALANQFGGRSCGGGERITKRSPANAAAAAAAAHKHGGRAVHKHGGGGTPHDNER